MVIVWIVGMLLCALVGYLAVTCKVQKKQRASTSSFWESYEWEDCKATIAYPRLCYILFILLSLVPFLNIIMCAALLCCYLEQFRGPRWREGDKVVVVRLVVSGKLVDWLMETV